MLKDVFGFFEKNINCHDPILIGLSGGPDSTFLLHMLLLWNKAPIHIVHVDHGWRSEATDERKALEKLACELKVPFHYTKLDPSTYTGNIEAASRDERYQFFRNVAKEVHAQGVVLGHQKDDLSETVFKRVLEGASLTALCGIEPIREVFGLRILRPLLTCTKKEILAWLDDQGLQYFSDPTNLQSKFLRGRLRSEVFPYLRTSFGKEFEESLCSIGEEARELKAYLDAQCQPYIQKALHGPWGCYFGVLPSQTCEIKYILRSLPLTLSRKQLQLGTTFIQEQSANKLLQTAEGSLFIDRGRVFYFGKPASDSKGSLPLQEGTYNLGEWQITVKRAQVPASRKNHFTDAWKGDLCVCLPIGEYTLESSNPKMRRRIGNSLSKEYGNFLNEKKIPHILVSKVPVICSKGEIVEDFLTGMQDTADPYLEIHLILI